MALFFYLFAALALFSSIGVVWSKNPVYSVLWLIFTFCNSAGLLILIGAEFISMMLIVIYVGAVAVLFLFVVMMLDIHFAEAKGAFKRNISFSFLIAALMFVDLALIVMVGVGFIDVTVPKAFEILPDARNTEAIGAVLYTDFMLPFQMSGIILLVAMIACIALTLKPREGTKRQNPMQQLARSKENSIMMVNIESNKGAKELKYDE